MKQAVAVGHLPMTPAAKSLRTIKQSNSLTARSSSGAPRPSSPVTLANLSSLVYDSDACTPPIAPFTHPPISLTAPPYWNIIRYVRSVWWYAIVECLCVCPTEWLIVWCVCMCGVLGTKWWRSSARRAICNHTRKMLFCFSCTSLSPSLFPCCTSNGCSVCVCDVMYCVVWT